MFEKDIYQLIRGLRAHKGNEREYIQESLKECRKEVKSQDMDQKATALLKLVYLEMFGHDMSWASFNVLEVMSSAKYLQKRVGYLAAVQSFRPDTEVLMLAENLLKKDLNSSDKIVIQLPLGAIPHVISPSMANSLLTDLLPRLSHSHPTIRKKTIVTLYRLALVYPETLRPAWPKIKERLLDEDEDPSVTAAIVNVVCELGWRRPHDFLPLAPRLFELLTAGGNNWMAIKIIKLFSVLTPIEPRLVKKLLPPLTSIIKTTPAMSLLYECINGIIQGGIMDAAGGTTEGDEIARLCVNKLRAMLVVEGDPNLRYVALLAFAKITNSHADLVSQHQDVILECIDDADISIRTRALDLVVGMPNAHHLQSVVSRLLRQLRTAGRASAVEEPEHDRAMHDGIIPMAEDDDEMQANVRPKQQSSAQAPPLPDDYRSLVVEKILDMCSRDNYANMHDFEWYIGVLLELVKECPAPTSSATDVSSMADRIGTELLNVAVRVQAVRPEAAAAAQSLLLIDDRDRVFPFLGDNSQGVLSAAAFVAGEYASFLPDAEAVLTSLTHTTSAQLPADALASYLQAIPKLFAALTGNQEISWSSSTKAHTALLAARITHFLEPLTMHPTLEVQEKAVEYLDLMRLATEATSNQEVDAAGGYTEPPLLLTQAIPALFTGMTLNPVAPSALRKVPLPEELDLNQPVNSDLQMLLSQAEYDTEYDTNSGEAYRFYYEKPSTVLVDRHRPAAELLEPDTGHVASYQDGEDEVDRETLLRKKAERRERYKDDPYYIDSERGSGTSTPMHRILRSANGEDLNVDDIPVMELKLDARDTQERRRPSPQPAARRTGKKRFEVAADETLGGDEVPSYSSSPARASFTRPGPKSLLQVDSSGLSSLSLDDAAPPRGTRLELERRQAEEDEMARAIREVERLRLEMQRAQERIQEPGEGTVVRRKKKKKAVVALQDADEMNGHAGEVPEQKMKKKRKKKKLPEGGGDGHEPQAREETHEDDEDGLGDGDGAALMGERPDLAAAALPIKAKRKKKRQVVFEEGG
jgi:AP-3 complex subunit delta-1